MCHLIRRGVAVGLLAGLLGCQGEAAGPPRVVRVVRPAAEVFVSRYGADDATRAAGVLRFQGDGQGIAALLAPLSLPPGAVLERVELRVFVSDEDGATGQSWIAADVVALGADDRLSSIGASAVSQGEGQWETLEAVLPSGVPAGPLGLYVTTLGSGASARYEYGIAWVALVYRR